MSTVTESHYERQEVFCDQCWDEYVRRFPSDEPRAAEVIAFPEGDLLCISHQEAAFGWYGPGRFAWVLRDIRAFEAPIPARGGLGLRNWEPPVGWEQMLAPVAA